MKILVPLVLLCCVIPGCRKSESEPEEPAAWIEEFKNRKIYEKLTVEILQDIPDEKLEQAIVDYILTKINDKYDNESRVVRGLSTGLRAVYTTWIVEGEVNNGGFNQYFWNTRGVFADDAVAGFKLFGANAHADLMRRAIAIRKEEAAKMAKFRERGTLEAFSESYEHTKLSKLDDEYYDLTDNLGQLRIRFIRQHPEMFVGD